MPRLIERPTIVQAAGNKPKQIQEFAGRVNSGHSGVSVARMVSPAGWREPGQRPQFEEITVVLRGMVRVESRRWRRRRACGSGGCHLSRRVDSLQQSRGGWRRIHGCMPAGLLAGHRSPRFGIAI